MIGASERDLLMGARAQVLCVLAAHAPADAKEADDCARIAEFVRTHDDPFSRATLDGHLTGSALVVSADGAQIALHHHRRLDLWLQMGGHAAPDERNPAVTALREAEEESGIAGFAFDPDPPAPLDIDVHAIPARPGEPAHAHLDLRYLLRAPSGATLRRDAAESLALRWFTWDEALALPLDPGLLRLIRKARRISAPV